MGSYTGGVPDEVTERVKEGLQAYFTVDAVERLFGALEIEPLIEEAAGDAAVDSEEMGKALGQLIGRMVAKEITSYVPLGQVIEITVGEKIGERIGEAAVVAFLEYGNPGTLIDRVRTATRGQDATEIVEGSIGERSIRSYVPGLGDEGAFAQDPADVTYIDVAEADEATGE